MTDWISEEDVRAALGLDPADAADDAWLTLCTLAVNQFVDDTRPVAPVTDPPTPVEVDGRTKWGAVQLATRWYSRRNSSDVSAFVELGGPPPSIDRDIEITLGLNRFYGPVVA
jgi:hypothetical protein